MSSKFGFGMFHSSFLVFFAFLGLVHISEQQDRRLTPMTPLASNIGSVSGLSSGGAKAFQFYLSHSSQLRGVGIIAGLIYECGLGVPLEIFKLEQCIRAGYNYTRVVNKIVKLANADLFDPLKNLESRRHFITHGTNDNLVNVENGNRIARFFTQFGTSQTVLYNRTEATHSLPTKDCGDPCSRKFPPSSHGCLKCGWSAPYSALNYIHNGTLKVPGNTTTNQCEPADDDIDGLFSFDQREFFPPRSEPIVNMGKTGYIYVPPRCQDDSSRCTVHIHIHGCALQASSPLTRLSYIKCSGFLGVAEANDIIILFPQGSIGISSISSILQCWDFVGYTGDNYGTKQGLQIKAIKNMFDRITGVNLPA